MSFISKLFKKQAKPAEKSEQERLLELGKMIQDFYDQGYVDRKKTLLFALLKGVASGFGAVLGGTFVVALLIWILSQLSHLPFIGDLSHLIEQSVQK